MKYSISYFYMIRFFKPNQIPISTAVWDPKWYHAFRNQDYVFIDKNGVINGLRTPILSPIFCGCGDCTAEEKANGNCKFKEEYYRQLNAINFKEYTKEIEEGVLDICSRKGIKDPEIVLIVHEAPDNPCSERIGLQKWFKNNGKILEEYKKE